MNVSSGWNRAVVAMFAVWCSFGSVGAVPDRKPVAPVEVVVGIQGKWRQVYVDFEGKEQKAEYAMQNQWVVTNKVITIFTRQGLHHQICTSWTYELHGAHPPTAIDITVGTKAIHPCLIEVNGNRLTICIQHYPERGRPKDLIARPNSGIGRLVYERMGPD